MPTATMIHGAGGMTPGGARGRGRGAGVAVELGVLEDLRCVAARWMVWALLIGLLLPQVGAAQPATEARKDAPSGPGAAAAPASWLADRTARRAAVILEGSAGRPTAPDAVFPLPGEPAGFLPLAPAAARVGAGKETGSSAGVGGPAGLGALGGPAPVIPPPVGGSGLPSGIRVQSEDDWPPLPCSFENAVVPERVMVVLAHGPCYSAHAGDPVWHPLSAGKLIEHGDLLRTGDHGYLVLSYSLRNLVLIKPKSGLRLTVDNRPADHGRPAVTLETKYATLAVEAEDAADITVATPKATIAVAAGEIAVQVTRDGERYEVVDGAPQVQLIGWRSPRILKAGMALEVPAQGAEQGPFRIDVEAVRQRFRRFAGVRERFGRERAKTSTETRFSLHDPLLHGKILERLPLDEHGFRLLDPGAGPAPRELEFRCRFEPYPTPNDRFEVQLGTERRYPLTEMGDGLFGARFPLPSFPEIDLRVVSIDHLGKRRELGRERVLIPNRASKEADARRFLRQLERAFAQRDWQLVRDQLDWEYRDAHGHTWYDFWRLIEDSFRRYRDLRLELMPHHFSFQRDRLQIAVSYRLSAMAPGLIGRFEQRGGDVITLVARDGQWKLHQRFRGMYFQRFQHALDLRRGVLMGRVTNEMDGSPVVGATVAIQGMRYRTRTDRLGEYVIHNLPPGRYDVEITRNGFGPLLVSNVEVRATGVRF